MDKKNYSQSNDVEKDGYNGQLGNNGRNKKK